MLDPASILIGIALGFVGGAAVNVWRGYRDGSIRPTLR